SHGPAVAGHPRTGGRRGAGRLARADDPGAGARPARPAPGLHDRDDRTGPAGREGTGHPGAGRPGLRLHRGPRRGRGDGAADAAAFGCPGRPRGGTVPVRGCALRRRRTVAHRSAAARGRRGPVTDALVAGTVITCLVIALFAVVGPRLARRLPPAAATRLLVPASLVVAGSSVWVLVVVAFTWVAQWPAVSRYGQWSAEE